MLWINPWDCRRGHPTIPCGNTANFGQPVFTVETTRLPTDTPQFLQLPVYQDLIFAEISDCTLSKDKSFTFHNFRENAISNLWISHTNINRNFNFFQTHSSRTIAMLKCCARLAPIEWAPYPDQQQHHTIIFQKLCLPEPIFVATDCHSKIFRCVSPQFCLHWKFAHAQPG